jgi:anti-sigma28 factor (negative regulator of flagellin synthesis)
MKAKISSPKPAAPAVDESPAVEKFQAVETNQAVEKTQNEDRLERLRLAVQAGTYNISAEALADALIDSDLGAHLTD